jgi:hypothetical protein
MAWKHLCDAAKGGDTPEHLHRRCVPLAEIDSDALAPSPDAR